MKKTFGYLFTLLALFGMGIGFLHLYQTEMRILNSVPTPARILDKKMEQDKNSPLNVFFARATYRYQVNGELYIGEKVMPYDFSSPDVPYLDGLIKPYEINKVVIAYCQRDNPKDSFLVKAIGYPPYMMVLSSLFLLLLGIWFIMTPAKSRPTLNEMKNVTKIQAVVFSVVSLLTLVHYFFHALKPYSNWEIGAVCTFLLISCILWKQALDCQKKADEFHNEKEPA